MKPVPNIPLPPENLRFMGEDDADFQQLGDLCLEMLKYSGADINNGTLLDIGCGYGRLPHALWRSNCFRGRYLGLDILRRQIEWCASAFKPLRNYSFVHVDVKNDRYNPAGKFSLKDLDFSDVGSVDHCALFSVFTHLYEADIRQWLKHIRTVLKPGGTLVFTAFTLRQPDTPQETEKADFPMKFALNDHCRYYNGDDPLHAIAYDRDFLADLLLAEGFEDLKRVNGSWLPGRDMEELDPFQDLHIARRGK